MEDELYPYGIYQSFWELQQKSQCSDGNCFCNVLFGPIVRESSFRVIPPDER